MYVCSADFFKTHSAQNNQNTQMIKELKKSLKYKYKLSFNNIPKY